METYRKDPGGFAAWSARLPADGASRTPLAHMQASPVATVTDLGPALRVVTALRHLVAETERRLLAGLDGADAAALLIDSGTCEEVGASAYERRRTHTCLYPLDILMTVRRYPGSTIQERLQLLRAR